MKLAALFNDIPVYAIFVTVTGNLDRLGTWKLHLNGNRFVHNNTSSFIHDTYIIA